MKPFRYRILTEWSEEDAAFVARVPAFPGCGAHGKSADEATREARLAAEGMLDVLRVDREAAPPEDAVADYSGNIRLRLPRSMHENLSRLATAEGVSLNQLMVTMLAERTGARRAGPRPAGATRKALRRKAVA